MVDSERGVWSSKLAAAALEVVAAAAALEIVAAAASSLEVVAAAAALVIGRHFGADARVFPSRAVGLENR
jgi:hypothetical protein